jgi:biopolymer transport protein ExbD
MSHGGDADCDPNLVPMLDLVLQLIMFFIVCVNLKQQDYNTKDLTLPSAQSARPLEKSANDPLFLNLNTKGELLLTGREPLKTEPEIRQYLKGEFAESERIKKKRVIIIRADQAAFYEEVYKVLRLCKDAGFNRLQLRAVQKGKS